MSVLDKQLSQARIAVALASCSPRQADILAGIAEAMAKAGDVPGNGPAEPIIGWLRERFCVNCGHIKPFFGCHCENDE